MFLQPQETQKPNLSEALKEYMNRNPSLDGVATLLVDGSTLHHLAVNSAGTAVVDIGAKALVLEDDASAGALVDAMYFSQHNGLFPRLLKALGSRGLAFFTSIRVYFEQSALTYVVRRRGSVFGGT